MGFIHLHCHSDYSLLDGIGTCEEYAKKCHENKMPYLCVTDHGMMGAIPAQTKACSDFGLKPIYGIEAYVNDFHELVPNYKHLSDEQKILCSKNAHLCLFARDEVGYRNLVRISSDAWINNFYRNPRTNKKFMKEHGKGIIGSSACLAGEIPSALLADKKEEARKILHAYRSIFDSFYLEIMLLNMDRQKAVNKMIVELAREEECPIIVTNDVHFEQPDDHFIQKIALLISSREGTLTDPKGLRYDASELWFKNEKDLDSYYLDHFTDVVPREVYEEAKENTLVIARDCEGVKIDTSPKLPNLPDARDKLLELVGEAMIKRGLHKKKEYVDRLRGELEIIQEKGFDSYFLIMKEIIDYAKYGLNSVVGPGRGSGPGFLVNYLLGLCEVDPIKYQLLSERFLSPHRGGKYAKLKFTKGPSK